MQRWRSSQASQLTLGATTSCRPVSARDGAMPRRCRVCVRPGSLKRRPWRYQTVPVAAIANVMKRREKVARPVFSSVANPPRTTAQQKECLSGRGLAVQSVVYLMHPAVFFERPVVELPGANCAIAAAGFGPNPSGAQWLACTLGASLPRHSLVTQDLTSRCTAPSLFTACLGKSTRKSRNLSQAFRVRVACN